MRVHWPQRLVLLATAAAILVVAAPASAAKTYAVSGKQIVVDEDKGIYKMRGGVIGRWTVTGFEESAQPPYYHGSGTEAFKGCLDRRHDRSCKGDPAGTLSMTFDYWALFGSGEPGALVWGSCWHPIVSGTGDFEGAAGVFTMVDTPTKDGVSTAYIGNVTLKGGNVTGHGRASSARNGTAGC